MFAMTKHDLFIDESIKKIRRQDNIVCIRGMGVELVLMDKQMKIQPSEDLKEQISDGYALIKQIVKTDWVINNEETAQKMVGIQEKWVKVIVSALQGTGKYVKSVNVFVAKHSFNIYLQFVQIKKRSVSKVWKTSPAKKIKRERQTEINNRTVNLRLYDCFCLMYMNMFVECEANYICRCKYESATSWKCSIIHNGII